MDTDARKHSDNIAEYYYDYYEIKIGSNGLIAVLGCYSEKKLFRPRAIAEQINFAFIENFRNLENHNISAKHCVELINITFVCLCRIYKTYFEKILRKNFAL